MAKPYVRSKTGVGSSVWIQTNTFGLPQATIQVDVTGTVNYTVEGTNDDCQDATVTPVVFAHAVLAAQTASKQDSYSVLPRFVRVTNNTGTGTSTLTLIQAGGAGL